MYIPRKLKKTFQSALRHFPAVLITGPRQSGKTTFLKHETKDISYVTFDDPLSRDYALKDANGFPWTNLKETRSFLMRFNMCRSFCSISRYE